MDMKDYVTAKERLNNENQKLFFTETAYLIGCFALCTYSIIELIKPIIGE